MLNSEPTLSEKACFVIDCMMSEGIAQDLEHRIGVHGKYDISIKELNDVNRTFCLVYMMAHVGNNPSCIKVHGDWIKKLNELYTKFKGEMKDG